MSNPGRANHAQERRRHFECLRVRVGAGGVNSAGMLCSAGQVMELEYLPCA